MRDYYMDTRRDYIEGKLHSTKAVALMCKDRTFIAECELNGFDPIEAAREVILIEWNTRAAIYAALERGA